MAEARSPVVLGLDEAAASGPAADFFVAFAAELEEADWAGLPASEALALLLDLGDDA